MYAATPTRPLHPSLTRYLHSDFVQTTRHNEDGHGRGYLVTMGGRQVLCGGLLPLLKARYYAHHKSNRSKRNHKRVAIKGSSAKQGIRVDEDLAAYTAGTKPYAKLHRMAQALVDYWHEAGHELQACQVPVQVEFGRVTQCDVITRHTLTGQLWCFECKTGIPTTLHRKQGTFAHDLKHVDCTGLNIWHLQLLHTRRALEAAGVEIAQSRVIQIYEKRDLKKDVKDVPKGKKKRAKVEPCELVVKVHAPPSWTGVQSAITKKRKVAD